MESYEGRLSGLAAIVTLQARHAAIHLLIA